MALTFKASDEATEFGSGTLATDAALNVAVGDLCVVIVGCMTSSTECDSMSDTAGNVYTVRTPIEFTGVAITIAWCIATDANANNIFTAGFTDEVGSYRKNIDAVVFTPDAGDTVSLDVSASGGSNWEDTPWETGQANTTGTDEVIIAGCEAGGTVDTSAHEIPGGTAATVDIEDYNGLSVWYRIVTATIANCYAECNVDQSKAYAMEFVAFKSVAAAPSGIVQQSTAYRQSRKRIVGSGGATDFIFGMKKTIKKIKKWFEEKLWRYQCALIHQET